jgi:glycosyltransferase involved in cell wall biosynthesis
MNNEEVINKEFAILQLVPALNSGGVERGSLEISQALIKNKFISHIASNGGGLVKNLLLQGAIHHKLPLNKKNPWQALISFLGLKKILLDNEIDLIHARSRWPAWIGFYIARRNSIPFITTFHGVYNFKSPLKRYYNSIMTRGEKVIAVSSFVRQHIIDNYSIDANKIVVINRGVDLSIFAPEKVAEVRVIQLAEKIRLRNFDKTIIMLPGRITRWKGHHLLIEALAKLAKKDFLCLLVGEEKKNSNYKNQLVKMIKQNNLEDRVIFTGGLSDMAAAYKLADIVVSTSIEPEAFGRVAVEAQAMGRIVLATNLGGSIDNIIDKKTGFLFEPNVNSLVESLEKAMNLTFEEKQEIQKEAINFVQNNFSIGQMMDKTLELYRNILS